MIFYVVSEIYQETVSSPKTTQKLCATQKWLWTIFLHDCQPFKLQR